MNTETNPCPAEIPNENEGSGDISEEWMPFLETYEQALRRGETRTPEQWLCDHPQLPKDLHGGLDQLYWLYGSREQAPALPAVLSPLPSVPGYEVLELLGRGGMGVVYKARQQSLKRIVALKMIRDGALADEEARKRFRREAVAVARLRHPHIVQVYEIGEQDGCPFFALEYVEGGSLAQRVRGTPQAPGEAARLVETLARTMSYAHQQGVVHRDLKPSNVLLVSGGVVSGDGPDTTHHSPLTTHQPKITDFGLAKQVNPTATGAGSETQSGAIVGTAAYMSPEQADGQTKAVGPGADIYSLGTILYELLAGRPPFGGATLVATMQQVLHDEPMPPRRLQPHVPRDLETICLKCLHKEPNKRYATAQDLAEDLRRFQDGEPIQARPIGSWERGIKWARRRPTAAALAVVSTLAGLLFVIGGVWSNAALRAAAAREHRKAEEAQAQQALAAAHMHSALDLCEEPLLEMNGAEPAKAPEPRYFRRDFLFNTAILCQKLLADTENPDRQFQRGIGRAFHVRGMYHYLLNERTKAQADYLEAVGRQEKLVSEFPGEQDYRLDLAITYHSLGILHEALDHEHESPDHKQEAAKYYESIAKLFDSLPAGNQRVARYAIKLSEKLWVLGKPKEALDWQNLVINWLEAGLRQQSLSDSQRMALPHTYFIRAGLLVELGRHKQAMDDFDRALEAKRGPPFDLPCRLARAVCLARIGDHGHATAEAETLGADARATPGHLCEVACAYALSVEAVRRDAMLPSAERTNLAERYGARAVALLARANAAGFFEDPTNLELLKNDPDLDALRPRADFEKLLNDGR
jgi:serine/threonine protein kinase